MSTTVPEGVHLASDGQYYRSVVVGKDADNVDLVENKRVCETCWKDIPKYVDFPHGLVSPEPSYDKESKPRQKVLCVPCYRKIYKEMAPTVDVPELSELAYNAPSAVV